VHKFNNLKFAYYFLENFLARCAHSISFYHPHLKLKICNVLYQLHLYVFLFWGSLSPPDWQLPKFTENTHKLHKIAYTMSNNCFRGGSRKRGRCENWGYIAMVVGGINAPSCYNSCVHCALPVWNCATLLSIFFFVCFSFFLLFTCAAAWRNKDVYYAGATSAALTSSSAPSGVQISLSGAPGIVWSVAYLPGWRYPSRLWRQPTVPPVFLWQHVRDATYAQQLRR